MSSALHVLVVVPLLVLLSGGGGVAGATAGAAQWQGMPQCTLGDGVGVERRADAEKHGCWRRYIVRFDGYALQEEHFGALSFGLRVDRRSAAALAGHWRWVWRDNPAVRGHPTDFGVVELSPRAAARRALSFEASLTRSPSLRRRVKDVFADVSFATKASRSLLAWVPPVDDAGWASKPPGRRRTKTSFEVQREVEMEMGMQQIVVADDDDDGGLDWNDGDDDADLYGLDGDNAVARAKKESRSRSREAAASVGRRRKLKLFGGGGVTGAMAASKVWNQGITGNGVKVGIFDTGVDNEHPSLRNVKERSNFTSEPTLSDSYGHGSFVAGVIGSTNDNCLGFAPDVDIYTFRVYTNQQYSYTSWFMDAFNYAIVSEMEIINVSIGGPDFLDLPFAEKALEVIANGIIMFAAQGNDGPLWGTANHPAEEPAVIAIGGIDYSDRIAGFTSRGMTLREFPNGYGRAKPDLTAYGTNVLSIGTGRGCTPLSGTSVASPVVTGAAALIASSMSFSERKKFMNPASMKQILVESATRLASGSIYEQGAGKVNLEKALEHFKAYTPHASLVPAEIDLTACPYMWPHCEQGIYAGAMATIFNTTIVNGMGLRGQVVDGPHFVEDGWSSNRLDVSFEFSDSIYPYAGWMAVFVRVHASSRTFTGTASGTITFTVESVPGDGSSSSSTRSVVNVPLKVNVIPTPPRKRRVLWDMFHNVAYPSSSAYIPRDNLRMSPDVLDHHGDHPHTNFHKVFRDLRGAGYFVETLGSPFTCFDASQYGHLLIVDPEEEFHMDEIAKLEVDVREKGLDVVIFAEWYNVDLMKSMRFYDDNTASWWTPPVGGANVPALNDLLEPFGAELGDFVFDGYVSARGGRVDFKSAVNIVRWPVGGSVFGLSSHTTVAGDPAATAQGDGVGDNASNKRQMSSKDVIIAGAAKIGAGSLFVIGDSTCADSNADGRAYWLPKAAIKYADEGFSFWPNSLRRDVLSEEEFLSRGPRVKRRPDTEFVSASKVIGHELRCGSACPCQFHDLPPLSRMSDPFTTDALDRAVNEDAQMDEFYVDILLNEKMLDANKAATFRGYSVSESGSSCDPSAMLNYNPVESNGQGTNMVLSAAATSINSVLSMITVLVICSLLLIFFGRRIPRLSAQSQLPLKAIAVTNTP